MLLYLYVLSISYLIYLAGVSDFVPWIAINIDIFVAKFG